MAFFQTPPELAPSLDDDSLLLHWLRRHVPGDALAVVEPELREAHADARALYAASLVDPKEEPRLTSWDAWGKRVDHIELTSLWKKAQRVAAERGVVATAYERKTAEHSRVHQFMLAYVLEPSWHVYSCPLAMTDGAAKTLLASGNAALAERALPRLLSRDPARAWTSGQWMTERTGGSDVGLSETVARQDPDDGRVHGAGRRPVHYRPAEKTAQPVTSARAGEAQEVLVIDRPGMFPAAVAVAVVGDAAGSAEAGTAEDDEGATVEQLRDPPVGDSAAALDWVCCWHLRSAVKDSRDYSA